MPNVNAPQTHEISLSDGVRKYGIILANGPRSIQETSVVGSTLVLNSQGGKYGDYDPSMAHLEQSDWSAGRGNEDFVIDNTRFFDSQNLWTLQENRVFPVLQWKFSGGYRNQDINQPGSIRWRTAYGGNQYLSDIFTASASYNADKLYLWVRRVGIPGTLTVELRTVSAGLPTATVLKSAAVSSGITEQPVSRILAFDWTGTQALVSSTQYAIVAYGAATDNAANHWEIGFDATGTGTYLYGTDGTNWTSGDGKLFYRVVDADNTNRTWKGVQVGSALYFVDNKGDSGVTPSQFYIVNVPSSLNEIPTTGLTAVTDVIWNGTMYFAQGESTNIRKWNGTTFADDGTNKATYLWAFNDPTAGPVVWRALANVATVSRANLAAYAATMSFGTAINVGDAAFPITGLTDYNNQIWVGKQDSLWTISNDRPSKYNIGMGSTPSSLNGRAMLASNNFLYVSYLHSLERIIGSTADDVGAWKGAGMPTSRNFSVADMESVLGWVIVAGQATSGTSCVMVYDGRGWHELLRAFETSKPIRMVKWQAISNGGGRLWADVGGDLMYCDFPVDTLFPLRDSSMVYQHEALLVTSTFDMGAKNMPKAWSELHLVTENLSNDTYIVVEYQADEDIGSSTWTELGTAYTSPNAFIPINVSDKYRMRFRLRLNTSSASTPPVLIATVVKCFGRVPTKYQWVLRAKVSDLQTTKTGAPDHDPDEILQWLKDCSQKAVILTMECKTLKALDKKRVIVEPPTPWRNFMSTVLNLWGGEIVITLREL